MRHAKQSPLSTVLGVLVAGVAVVGTQVLGWEWGDGGLVPTAFGVAVACVAVAMALRRRLT